MATFSTNNKQDKNEIVKNKAREALFKSVSELMQKADTIEPSEKKSKLNITTIISRGGIPESHRTVADSFMIIKKIFGHPVVQCKLIPVEKDFLAKYDFNPIEFSTSKQIEEELTLLRKWSYSRNIDLQRAADNLINIRAKELKYLIAINYITISNGIYDGYKTLEKYFASISKYQ